MFFSSTKRTTTWDAALVRDRRPLVDTADRVAGFFDLLRDLHSRRPPARRRETGDDDDDLDVDVPKRSSSSRRRAPPLPMTEMRRMGPSRKIGRLTQISVRYCAGSSPLLDLRPSRTSARYHDDLFPVFSPTSTGGGAVLLAPVCTTRSPARAVDDDERLHWRPLARALVGDHVGFSDVSGVATANMPGFSLKSGSNTLGLDDEVAMFCRRRSARCSGPCPGTSPCRTRTTEKVTTATPEGRRCSAPAP